MICLHLSISCLYPPSLPPLPPARSQRDTAGEREERLRQLEGHREHLGHLDNELQTAANDKKQFENAFNHCGDDLRQNQ